MSVFDGMDTLALRTTAKMQAQILAHIMSTRSNRIDELEAALREAIEIIEGTGLDASIQRAAIAKATGEQP